MQEGEHEEHEEHRGGSHRGEDGGIDTLWVLSLLVGETEESGLHAIGEDNQEERRIGIHIGDDPIAATLSRERGCIDGHQEVVEKTTNDATQSVDGCIFQQ